jgi:hypothetical protein
MPRKDAVLEGLDLAIERAEHALESLSWMESSKAVQDVLDCGQPRQLQVRLGFECAMKIVHGHLAGLKEERSWWEAWDGERV